MTSNIFQEKASNPKEDFLVEFNSPVDEEVCFVWMLLVDGSLNIKGRGATIVLEGLGNIMIKSLKNLNSGPTTIRPSVKPSYLVWSSP